ncbi:carboxypeptidase-like regulatory domain-containing protein [Sulfurisphaera ohwakuensis]|uniref:Outer membrane murein-binding lipoprotein Lpp n=1 Tax=Sulfurisphaera ohwakuensis TaxID=69656 RepID=A0A650CK33_SULOH|nr:carboxypeptidase-like regulatory domain-containing protein [Sulfurisphaera ohwakuensis]MBB5254951.1 outer membrane murein-binding lipoprotein Lpp [Sulfurisphaera ohwakuensis]QGR17827.1 hypothetical protein D1869_12060 [Sulfurisphaera ohwakuensis]
MNMRFVIGLILSIIVLGFSVPLATASTSLVVISPTQGEVFHFGQPLVVTFKYAPGATVAIYVLTPSGANIPVASGATNSSGYFSQEIWVWGSSSENSQVGAYTIEIEVNGGQAATSVTVYYKPYTATIKALVENEQGIPLQGATVSVYNVTSGLHELIATATTGSNGIATIQVIAFNFTENLEVVASYPGYVNASQTISVVGNQTISLTFKLYPAIVTVLAVGELQNGIATAALNPFGYTSLTGTEGDEITVLFAVEFAGMKVTNATVTASVATPSGVTTMTATPITSGPYAGYYNVTFMLPALNTTYLAFIDVNATYNGISGTLNVPIQAEVNYTTIFTNYVKILTQEIQSVNQTVYTLMGEIKSLNASISQLSATLSSTTTEITTLENDIKTLESSVSSLNGTVSSLSSTVSNLSSQVNKLNSEVSSITPLVYGGLIAGIIGLIVAIVAIVLVYRKIS